MIAKVLLAVCAAVMLPFDGVEQRWGERKLESVPLVLHLPGDIAPEPSDLPADAGPLLKEASFYTFSDDASTLHATVAVAKAEDEIKLDRELLEMAAIGIGDAIEGECDGGFKRGEALTGSYGDRPAVAVEFRYTISGLEFVADVLCIGDGSRWLVITVGYQADDAEGKSASRRVRDSIRYGGKAWAAEAIIAAAR